MKKVCLLIAGLAVAFAAPAAAETVVVKRGHGGHERGARAEMGHGHGHGNASRHEVASSSSSSGRRDQAKAPHALIANSFPAGRLSSPITSVRLFRFLGREPLGLRHGNEKWSGPPPAGRLFRAMRISPARTGTGIGCSPSTAGENPPAMARPAVANSAETAISARNPAFKARSALPLGRLLCSLRFRCAAGHRVLGHQVAEFRMSVTAIIDQEGDD